MKCGKRKMRETFETTLADGRSIYKPMVPRCWFYRMIASEAFKAGDRVLVTGLARINPHSGKIEEIKIEKLEVLDELMLGARDFTAGYDLKQLADMQAVHPLARPDDLAGGWPEDESLDEFIETTYGSRN